ncbi:MAG: 4Fe-4S dicluster domain-containing protein [Bacillota bacterium]
MQISRSEVRSDFVLRVEEISGEKILGCYQCGKCSAGCPMIQVMDCPPHQVLRLTQLGSRDEVLASGTIWLCASCQTCASRCPRGVDLSRIMEALRAVRLRAGQPALDLGSVPKEVLGDVPQQALVASLRKYTS